MGTLGTEIPKKEVEKVEETVSTPAEKVEETAEMPEGGSGV